MLLMASTVLITERKVILISKHHGVLPKHKQKQNQISTLGPESSVGIVLALQTESLVSLLNHLVVLVAYPKKLPVIQMPKKKKFPLEFSMHLFLQ